MSYEIWLFSQKIVKKLYFYLQIQESRLIRQALVFMERYIWGTLLNITVFLSIPIIISGVRV